METAMSERRRFHEEHGIGTDLAVGFEADRRVGKYERQSDHRDPHE
jgi:hypothetical protein